MNEDGSLYRLAKLAFIIAVICLILDALILGAILYQYFAHCPRAHAGETMSGQASYYGQPHAGRATASGELFDPSEMTAAHRTIPFGTRVRVTNQENGKSVEVRINDRGPFVPGRIIDVSRAAAEALGFVGAGTACVRLEVLD